ncbi:MAG: hypothetical protein SGI92_03430 [Bryobacteraceae bacterium]|nr:hypothetical protein [Bryobacteraceae bacterium]
MPVTCALCGTAVVVDASALPPPAEPPDFDTRPGEPLRPTLPLWVQQCPSCGFAADDLGRAAGGLEEIVRSAEYQELRSDDSVPAGARPFLCYSYLLDRLHQPSDAGWSCLHAAWACDDAASDAAAVACRLQAIELWKKGKVLGQSFSDDLSSEFALVTDVCRRAAQFEHATVACSEGLEVEDIPFVIEKILRRQMVLIQSRDTTAHNIREFL